jgi:hypothetical protein
MAILDFKIFDSVTRFEFYTKPLYKYSTFTRNAGPMAHERIALARRLKVLHGPSCFPTKTNVIAHQEKKINKHSLFINAVLV